MPLSPALKLGNLVLTPYFHIFKRGFVYFGHGVVSNEGTPAFFPNLHMKLSEFSYLIDYWLNLGFTFISFEELSDIILSGKRPKKSWIHLTFDDGYKNNLTTIYPYLKSRNIPFTIFISTNHILQNKRFDNYKIACALKHTTKSDLKTKLIEKYKLTDFEGKTVIKYFKYLSISEKSEFLSSIESLLTSEEWDLFNKRYSSEDILTPDEVKQLSADPLVKIASHGANHYILSTLNENELNYEFAESKNVINQLTGNDPVAYCYPNGSIADFTQKAMDLCQQNGYKFAFTTINKKYSTTENYYSIPRIPLSTNNLIKKVLRVGFGI